MQIAVLNCLSNLKTANTYALGKGLVLDDYWGDVSLSRGGSAPLSRVPGVRRLVKRAARLPLFSP